MSYHGAQMIQCPYCGELIEVLIDPSLSVQEYVEDCQVCCRPIILNIECKDAHQPVIKVRKENE